MSVNSKKKSAAGKIVCKNGISFRSDITFSTSRRTDVGIFTLIRLLITIAAAISTVYMAESFLSPEMVTISNFPIIVSVVFLAFAIVIMNNTHGFFRGMGAAYMIVYALFILFKIKETVSGMIYVVYVYASKARLTIPISADSSSLDADIFFLTLAFVLTIVLSSACIYRVNFPIMFICTFPVFELGAFWGWEPATWTVMVMIICWILTLAINIISHTTRNRNSSNTFAIYRKKKTFYLTSDRIKQSFFSVASGFTVVLTAAVFAFGVIAAGFLGENYRPESFTDLRRNIHNGFISMTEEISERTNISSSAFPGKGKMVGGTNGGRLGQYDSISYSGYTALYVTTSKFNKTLYLRGYAAENYNNNEWNPVKLDEDSQSQFSELGNTLLDYDYLELGGTSAFSVSVKTEKANKELVYAPYGTLYSSCGNVDGQEYDGMATVSDKKTEYSLSGLIPNENSWSGVLDYVSEQASGDNRFYIYDSYVQSQEVFNEVPDEISETLNSFIASSGATSDMSVAEIADCLKDEFTREGFVYTLEPGRTPVNEDFVEYFLSEQKKGYCTYYASAGVMLMRSLGYPARYVEGYVVQPSQYKSDSEKIRVTDRCAHAWCEVYIAGMGWYPIEFTPGYSNDNPNLTDTEKNIKNDSSSEASSSQSAVSAATVSTPSNSSQSSKSSASSSSKSSSQGKSNQSGLNSGETSYGGTESDENASTDNSGGEISGYTVSKTGLASVSISAIFVIFAAVFTIIRRKTRLEVMSKKINSTKKDKAVIACYSYCLEYLELIGIHSGANITDTQSAKEIYAGLKEFDPTLAKPFLKLSEMAITSHMREGGPGEDDLRLAQDILDNIAKRIYVRLSTVRRFTAKWIRNLY